MGRPLLCLPLMLVAGRRSPKGGPRAVSLTVRTAEGPPRCHRPRLPAPAAHCCMTPSCLQPTTAGSNVACARPPSAAAAAVTDTQQQREFPVDHPRKFVAGRRLLVQRLSEGCLHAHTVIRTLCRHFALHTGRCSFVLLPQAHVHHRRQL